MSLSTDAERDRDLARRLGAYLEEGAVRAPERSVAVALAHAQAHPRRRDPLSALRGDPMAGGPRAVCGGWPRPLALAAALGLLLLTLVAVAGVGGWFRQAPSVVMPTPSPSPTVSPSALATPLVIRRDLQETVGADAEIEITDASFTLVDAVSGVPADGGSVTTGTVSIEGDETDPTRVSLTWTGGVCETLHQLAIELDGRTMHLFQPTCGGDSIPRDLVLVLGFDHAVNAGDFRVTLEQAP
jgi:hypothetical protein